MAREKTGRSHPPSPIYTHVRVLRVIRVIRVELLLSVPETRSRWPAEAYYYYVIRG